MLIRVPSRFSAKTVSYIRFHCVHIKKQGLRVPDDRDLGQKQGKKTWIDMLALAV